MAGAGRRLGRVSAGALCLVAFCYQGAAFPYKQIITPAGPIKTITVGQDGSLQIEHTNYPGIGQFFPPEGLPADSGFFLRHDGQVDGMDYAFHDSSAASSTRAAAFYPISQTQSTDGLLLRTVMDNRTDGTGVPFLVSQDVSYVPGDSWFLVSVTVSNQSTSAQTVDMFAAGDIYLADEDVGHPFWSTQCVQVAIGGSTYDYSFNIFQQAAWGSPAPTSYQEDLYEAIWSIIGNGTDFADTTVSEYLDNGSGLEWQGVTIPAGDGFTVAYYWALGTLGCLDLTTYAQAMHVFWSPGATNMTLHWGLPGYLLQASTNGLRTWDTLPIPITKNEATVRMEPERSMFFRLASP